MSRSAWIRIHFCPGSGSASKLDGSLFLVLKKKLKNICMLSMSQQKRLIPHFKKDQQLQWLKKLIPHDLKRLVVMKLSAQNSILKYLRMTRNRLIFRPEPWGLSLGGRASPYSWRSPGSSGILNIILRFITDNWDILIFLAEI